jgi:cbb3-type cytochrome oxidase maturation protein
MIVIYLLIPLSIVIAVGFLAAFIWAVRSGQYEDTHTPSLRMLWDDRGPLKKNAACHDDDEANTTIT